MLKIKNKKIGMTLIELLIVIAIIGILASVILSSLTSSREKGFDTQVKQQLIQFRNAAEVYFYNQTPPSYGPSTMLCNDAGTLFVETSPNNGNPAATINSTNLPYSTIVCGTDGRTFAIKATLYDGNSYFCVDSKGSAKLVPGPIGASVNLCPS